MKELPFAARLYVTGVIIAGAAVVAYFVPHAIEHPGIFLALLLCSSLASALKVDLPLASGGSTMSVSYAVDFVPLLLLGANETMLVAGTSAWAQCTFKTRVRSAPVRTAFSMASLVLTVKAAGWVFTELGGPPPFQSYTILTISKPLVGAGTAYFVFNTTLVASARRRGRGRRTGRLLDGAPVCGSRLSDLPHVRRSTWAAFMISSGTCNRSQPLISDLAVVLLAIRSVVTTP